MSPKKVSSEPIWAKEWAIWCLATMIPNPVALPTLPILLWYTHRASSTWAPEKASKLNMASGFKPGDNRGQKAHTGISEIGRWHTGEGWSYRRHYRTRGFCLISRFIRVHNRVPYTLYGLVKGRSYIDIESIGLLLPRVLKVYPSRPSQTTTTPEGNPPSRIVPPSWGFGLATRLRQRNREIMGF